MARRSILDEEETTTIDLAPMIDCIFILLIFFIVTTVFVEEQGFAVNKPDAAAPTQLEESEALTFEITSDDEVLLDAVEVSLADVTRRVKASAGDEETPVVIRAHAQSDHGTFVSVWDAAKRGGAELLSFTTFN